MTLDALQVMRDIDVLMHQNEMITLEYSREEYIALRESGGVSVFEKAGKPHIILDKSPLSLDIKESDKSGVHALSKVFIEREVSHEGLDRFLQAGFRFGYTTMFGPDASMKTLSVIGTGVHSRGTSAEDCFSRILAYVNQKTPEEAKHEIATLLKSGIQGTLHLLKGDPPQIAYEHR